MIASFDFYGSKIHKRFSLSIIELFDNCAIIFFEVDGVNVMKRFTHMEYFNYLTHIAKRLGLNRQFYLEYIE